jgi:hypothetical protein
VVVVVVVIVIVIVMVVVATIVVVIGSVVPGPAAPAQRQHRDDTQRNESVHGHSPSRDTAHPDESLAISVERSMGTDLEWHPACTPHA